MTSQIDPSVIQDNVRVNKADLREQFEIAKDEISELQKRSSPAFEMAFEEDFDGNLFNVLDAGAPLTPNGIVIGQGANSVKAISPLQDGEILVGQTGAEPIAASMLDVFSPVIVKTANDSINASQARTTFTNEGAAGSVTLALPTPVVGLIYTFVVATAQDFIIDVGSSVEIVIGPSNATSAGGQITANEVGAFVTLLCINSTRWQAISGSFGWSPS